MTIPAGAFATLLGPSGCGKTTLLKLVGGYLMPQCGEIRFGGQPVTALPPERRNVGMVFQNYALFPHLTARKNVAFGLETRRVDPRETERRVAAILDRVGLTAAERDRYPAQLSGGQQQRVALARALSFSPPVLLLDEPLSSLDRQLREQMGAELSAVHKQSDVTSLMVTHDQAEALALSDFVGVMRAGRLIQFGTPRELYLQPATPFVARFLGDANLIDSDRLGFAPGSTCLVRPDQIRLNGDLPGRVISVRFFGADLAAEVQCADFVLKIRCPAETELAIGDPVSLDIPRHSIWHIPQPDEMP